MATWSKGVPPVEVDGDNSESGLKLWFANTTSPEAYWADTTGVTFDTSTVPTAAGPVSCSFAGGCMYSVSGNGLASLMSAN
jgi:hypothetical protein